MPLWMIILGMGCPSHTDSEIPSFQNPDAEYKPIDLDTIDLGPTQADQALADIASEYLHSFDSYRDADATHPIGICTKKFPADHKLSYTEAARNISVSKKFARTYSFLDGDERSLAYFKDQFELANPKLGINWKMGGVFKKQLLQGYTEDTEDTGDLGDTGENIFSKENVDLFMARQHNQSLASGNRNSAINVALATVGTSKNDLSMEDQLKMEKVIDDYTQASDEAFAFVQADAPDAFSNEALEDIEDFSADNPSFWIVVDNSQSMVNDAWAEADSDIKALVESSSQDAGIKNQLKLEYLWPDIGDDIKAETQKEKGN